MAIWTITKLTLREASRRRLLIAVALLTLIVALLSGWAFHKLISLPCGSDAHPHPCSSTNRAIIASTLVIMLMFMFSFVLALGAAFLGSPAIANETENGLLLAILPRPIRRSDVLIGKWLGLAILLALYAGVACGIELIIVRIAMGFTPPHPILSIAWIVAESLIVLTLAVTLSTRVPAMTAGITLLVLFGVTWIAGVAGAVGVVVGNKAIQNVGTISSLILPTDGLWRAAMYNLEPAALVAVSRAAGEAAGGNPFLALTPPSTPYELWVLAWGLVVLGAGVWSFNRREL